MKGLRLFPLLLLLLLAGTSWAGIEISDTTLHKVPWLILEAKGKSKPTLRIKDQAATLDLADGTRLELRSGKASLLSEGKLHVLSPAPRIVDGALWLPRKATQTLFENLFPSQFLCEDEACSFTGSDTPEPRAEKASKVKAPAVVASPKDPDPPALPMLAAAAAKARKDFTVVIDAGHGGKDPGASGKTPDGETVREKDVTLGVAKKLREALKRAGFKVVMTREDDHFEELKARTAIANRAKGDLFVSLHCNAVPSRKDQVKGFRVYLLREAQSEKDKAIERRENEAIRLESPKNRMKRSLTPIEWMQIDHQLNLYSKESERFSGLLVTNLGKMGTIRKEHTGAGQAGFFVLVGAMMPSVLIEMGYVSHPDEAAILADNAHQERIASGISRSIETFFTRKSSK